MIILEKKCFIRLMRTKMLNYYFLNMRIFKPKVHVQKLLLNLEYCIIMIILNYNSMFLTFIFH